MTRDGHRRYPGLYRPEYEHDACGVGFVADIQGRRSHAVLDHALTAVVNMAHRGAASADGKTGDGAGVLTQIPRKFFVRELASLGLEAPAEDDLAVGMIFLPREPQDVLQACIQIIEEAIAGEGLTLLGWRQAPTDPSVLGERALAAMPDIRQVLIARPERVSAEEFPRALYLARKRIERWVSERDLDQAFYIPSFSNRTLAYKGLLASTRLRDFYTDLQDADYETALAVLHQRYSTNTVPNWVLAQPFRFLAHNGEINTFQGNRNWLRAREPELASQVWGDRVGEIPPIIQRGASDSCALDNALEAMVLSGRDAIHAMMMLVPEPWENMPNMDPALRAFYQYNACVTEPWDGPAALAFSDGVVVAATLDRNGLRPARYAITDDDLVIMASEVGVVEFDEARIVKKGRLGPGQMIAVDTANHRLYHNDEIKEEWASRQPYRQWVQESLTPLNALVEQFNGHSPSTERATTELQRVFGYTSEEVHLVLMPMIAEAKEPVGSMGDDTPLAVLSAKPRLLYSYFKQKFAQVTNPAIDPYREELVMSLYTYLGHRRSLFEDDPEHARLLFLEDPVLDDLQLSTLRQLDSGAFQSRTFDATFPVAEGATGLEKALARLCQEASEALKSGVSILILSDRAVDAGRAPVPMMLAVGGVHHHLIRQGQRMMASLVAETGEARDMHQICCLLGYGAGAVNPYLALSTIHSLLQDGHLPEELDVDSALRNYRKILNKQILKIMSKMGISAVSAYHGAQIFECVGLGEEVVDRCFANTPSQISGVGFREIAGETLARHTAAFGEATKDKLDDHGYYRFRKDGETHAFTPPLVRMVHTAVKSGAYDDYQTYLDSTGRQGPVYVRDLMEFKKGSPVDVEEVEPAEDIVRRFFTGSMSLGALSPEAHEVLAMGMNALGARSETGEGGEDPLRFHGQRNGYTMNSFSKQVASGRFGVTPEYLAMAGELQIKMAQGSKPGEGGQLPAHKVVAHIARIRQTQPGVPLISPPPHHDIYSIEDLAQLIYDLKMVNPRARVNVKLVAEAGVGTIAAGVAKGYADTILISGMEGGTGASPLMSIKNAGSAWELGLAETQQILVMNDLRGRVRLATDGGLRTGRDIVLAAMLGAEEYGFGTQALVAIGCTMARQCHLNTCPVGVATQREDLREKFWGEPEHVVRFMMFVAEEVRHILASLGYRKLEEVIGLPDLLEYAPATEHPKARTLDYAKLLDSADPSGLRPRMSQQSRNDRPEPEPLDNQIIRDAAPALEGRHSVDLSYAIRNVNRTVGGRLGGEVAHRYGDAGLPDGITITCRFKGSAGQSFGAWGVNGLVLILEGEANDYVAKGTHGGTIALRPSEDAVFASHENVIMGNTVLYGATGGYLFAAGRAGERFAIRNSGAWAVIEGAGAHCCEYMTGGCVVVLGDVGRNFGAGMSGGIAFVLDEDNVLERRYNPEMVGVALVEAEDDVETLRMIIEQHAGWTGSARAKQIMEHWSGYLPLFKKVSPHPTVAPPQPRDVQKARRDAMLADARSLQGGPR